MQTVEVSVRDAARPTNSTVIRLPIAFPKRSRRPLTLHDAVHFAEIARQENRVEDAIRLIDIATSICDYGGVRT